MDPDANLREQREITARLNDGILDTRLAAQQGERLAELVHALDHWIGRGGFLPRDWQRAQTDPNAPKK